MSDHYVCSFSQCQLCKGKSRVRMEEIVPTSKSILENSDDTVCSFPRCPVYKGKLRVRSGEFPKETDAPNNVLEGRSFSECPLCEGELHKHASTKAKKDFDSVCSECHLSKTTVKDSIEEVVAEESVLGCQLCQKNRVRWEDEIVENERQQNVYESPQIFEKADDVFLPFYYYSLPVNKDEPSLSEQLAALAAARRSSSIARSVGDVATDDPNIMMKPDVTDVEAMQVEEGEDNSSSSRLRINHFLIPVLTLEALILVCLAVLAYYLRFTDEFPVFERAILCDDSTLKYPFFSSNHATFEVQEEILYAICFLFPPVLFVIGELGFWLFSSKPRKVIRAHCSTCNISLTSRRLLRFIGTFLLGAFCTSILTDGLKLLAGRPRPYFLSICDPQGILCSLSTNKILNGTAACSSNFNGHARIARTSFPSFYASLASYAGVYTMVYLHNILRMHGTYALRPLLVLIIAGLSMLAGFSRLMTYRNHWEDVLAGYILGSTIAIYFAVFLMNAFKEHAPKRHPEIYVSRAEERSRFFRWFWIPRISFGKNIPRNYGGIYSNSNGQMDKGPLEPNPAFQQDLHRRIENFGRKNLKQPQATPRKDEESQLRSNEDMEPRLERSEDIQQKKEAPHELNM